MLNKLCLFFRFFEFIFCCENWISCNININEIYIQLMNCYILQSFNLFHKSKFFLNRISIENNRVIHFTTIQEHFQNRFFYFPEQNIKYLFICYYFFISLWLSIIYVKWYIILLNYIKLNWILKYYVRLRKDFANFHKNR